jgi:hypothetical protein
MTMTENPVENGVNVEALLATREAMTAVDVFRDRETIRRHNAAQTHPRVSDMHTQWGRDQAWDLFFQYGRR